MKILTISSYENSGGAARASFRLHKALLERGIDSQMLVQQKSSNDYTILSDTHPIKKGLNIIRPLLDNMPVRLYKNRDPILFSPSSLPFSQIVKKINQINPDIVHMHWICGGMMRIEQIANIIPPIVWSLHDNWAFTGGCHINLECDKYKENCGACPRLKSNKKNDLSRRVWKRKKTTYSRINNLTIVGLSSWLNNCSKESTLLKDKEHVHLPNPIDCSIFKTLDKKESRKLWNFPINKKIILFGAMNPNDIVKGFQELKIALSRIDKKNVEFAVFGSRKPNNSDNFGFKTHYLGHIFDDSSLVTLYNSVDVTVVPSLQENLSNTIMESMACATPVVGFDVGGNSDLIEHKKSGYLAKPFDSGDLATGIDWILNNDNYNKISNNARQKIIGEFEATIVANRYIDLYKQILLKTGY